MLHLLPRSYDLSEKVLGLLSESIGEAALFIEDDRVSFANETCRKIFKFSPDDLAGLSVTALVRTLGLKHEEEYLAEKDFEVPYNDELTRQIHYTDADGHQGILQIRVRACLREQEINGKLVIFRDITQKIAMKAERERLQRISTLGKISAGVAHDLNHLLSVIYLENTKLLLQTSKRNKESLEKMETAITQAIGIVSRIRDFGKVDKASTCLIDINELIERTLGLLRTHWEAQNNLSGKKINISFTPGPLQPAERVEGNLSSLSSVLINLVTNAMDAIKEQGQIKIGTSSHDGRVFVSVSDDGVGMDPEVQLNLFQPYYSTKQERGTGLGLFISQEIIKEHGGAIRMISAPENGTTFIISLPFAGSDAREDKAKVDPASTMIMIVEDEKSICSLLSNLFLEAGYQVMACETRDEAVERLKENMPGLIISDLCVPGLSFHDLARAVKSVSSNIPIILLSGYGSDIDDDTRNRLGIKAVISKPFSNEGLLNTVERILTQRISNDARVLL